MKAFIVVDLQNDFLPGGSLAVSTGHAIIQPINQLLQLPFDIVVATKDWHPKDHGSFASVHGKKVGEHIQLNKLDQILWPDHCIQNSSGADFSINLDTQYIKKIFYKGTTRDVDSYSAFFDNAHLKSTGLYEFLKEKNVDEVFIAGLTTEYCVKYSALDALKLGFKTHVIVDACKAVNLGLNDEEKALKEMSKAGIILDRSDKIKGYFNGVQGE